MTDDEFGIWQMGFIDGWNGDPPEQRFLDVERSAEEWELWRWGRRDGEALRRQAEEDRVDQKFL